MLTVTKTQALERWDELPMALREALYSEANSDFLWKTCEAEYIPKEKIYTISKILGWVLMGFLHPEDFTQEVIDEIQIDKRIAITIGTALDSRIFTPLRADIDKAYKPLGKTDNLVKAIQDVAPARADAPKIIPTGIPVPAPSVPKAPAPMAVPFAAPAPVPAIPKPNLAATGWSKLPSAAFVPKPAAIPPTTTPTPKASASAPKPASEPAPVIIHEDAIFKAQPAKPDFHIAIHPEDLEIKKTANVVPLKPAVLELGKVPTPTPAKVVHYDEFKEKLFANIPAPGAKGVPQRNITEITAMPKPPAPPTPVAPAPQAPLPPKPAPAPAPAPKPSIAPTKMAEEIKVVQKDYL